MVNKDQDMTLARYIEEYANDPDFIAEGLSIKVVEEMLECLEEKGMSQSWLADKMGVSRALVSRILNAPPNMTLLTIAKIAVALGMTPDVSLNARGSRPSPVERVATTVSESPGNEYKG